MHAITEHDKGYVLGTTWHKHPNYITQDVPVTIEQAMECLEFPMTVEPSFRFMPDGTTKQIPGAFHVIRPDKQIVLAPFVGSRYDVLSNRTLVEHVNDNVLGAYPDLTIESVGTLFQGKIAFVNLLVKEWKVDGDSSKSQHRLMYYNPIGLGAYKVCCHTTRVVCNNTLRIASAQGAANDTLKKISHTKTASTRIANVMSDLSKTFLELETFEEQVRRLAHTKMTLEQAEAFFKHVFKLDNPKTQVSTARAQQKYEQVMNILRTDTTVDSKSAWGVLNAFTNVIDHATPRESQDVAMISWDALVGDRAKTKDTVFQLLLDAAAA